MKSILKIIYSIILPLSLSVKVSKPRLCINCKHFISDHDTGKYGKCSLFPTKEYAVNFLVNGIIDKDEYYYCSSSRESSYMCGVEGKMYKKKKIEKDNSK
jgi:hypothetical protein